MDIIDVLNPKGVPKKLWSMFFKSRGQKSKVQTSTNQPDQPVGGMGGPNTIYFC